MKIATRANHFWQELKLFDGPIRWLYWLSGLVSIWVYQQGDLNAGAVTGLFLYLLLNLILIPLMPKTPRRMQSVLAVMLYVTDLLFASLLIYHTGGLVSQLFLLYCLLVFKAAIYYPYVHSIIFVPFLIFPLYVATLYLNTSTIVFLQQPVFISRYGLLLVVVFAGLYTAWHLDGRHEQTRSLLGQLETEHRQLEERRRELRTVLDSIGDGVIVVNARLELLMINPFAADLFGIPYPQTPGTNLVDLVDDPSLLDLLRRAVNDAPHTDELIRDEISLYRRSSGKSIVCEALATPLVSPNAALHGAVVVIRDMTRQRELEEAKTNFISVLSHELRTPLTAIRGFLELILTGDAGPVSTRQDEFLKIAFDQSEQLGDLINALLEFAEMEASETSFDFQSVVPERLVQKALERAETQAQQRNILLQTEIPTSLSPIYADGERLERTLFNLIDNALKFSPEGGQVTVSVSVHNADLLFCVTDTGPGIPHAERENVFERFYQIDNSSTREHGGTGLGLAMCKHIVEMHHGTIWVEDPSKNSSEHYGPGSRFCFTIPRDLEQRADLVEPVATDDDQSEL